jgi:uncharacterized 2Fe-2S/4Fe-4S cluster protein (DUF4445 family)
MNVNENRVTIELLPLGEVVHAEPGTPLQDVLFDHGVEFPCGGRGRCRGCKVKVLGGALPITGDDRLKLRPHELAQGWRLACRAQAAANLRLELAQWDAPILTDDSAFAFEPQTGLGVAIDLGTTTLVAQLVDRANGRVLAVRAALNPQARHGADIMSRVEFALADEGRRTLTALIRSQLGQMIQELLDAAPHADAPLKTVVLVGNTVMHHLFSGLDLAPLSHVPFEPESPGLQVFRPGELDWSLPGDPVVRFLPCLGGFVGSDILAGVLATRLHEAECLTALIDLGTNGEILLGNRTGMLCASTAAGPAFEGARISMGMRAATGAIAGVRVEDGKLACHVLGGGIPRGLCGSGLVDAVAAALDLGWLHATGRLVGRTAISLCPPVTLTQRDVRELQLAKGAIAAGLRLLLQQSGASRGDLARIYLAGAFGNYINYASARRIGLLDFPLETIRPAGNTALLGAKLALFSPPAHNGAYSELAAKIRHVSLHEDARFQDAYVQEMAFPALPAPVG